MSEAYTGKKFHLELGDIHVIHQGPVGDTAWGHYQFPSLYRTAEGKLHATWSYSSDTIEYDGEDGEAISDDCGKTWRKKTDKDHPLPIAKMKNGKYFGGFVRRGAHPVTYFENHTPGAVRGDFKVFFAEDITEAPEDTEVYATEYDPVTHTSETFKVKINWPYMPISEHSGHRAYPLTMVFALCECHGHLAIKDDDDLYYCCYICGFDSTAKSRAECVMKYSTYNTVYVFKSSDCGRTWDYLSQISVDDSTFDPSPRFEGLDEPMMTQAPDGSVVMLIRTGSDNPSYLVRSTDKCRTWTKPVKFDDLGVKPQILTLDCGITLASYGRPEMRLRATSDPAALVWEDPIKITLSEPTSTNPFRTSCFYTHLMPLDSHTALWAYSDFFYPNPDGDAVKSVLCRTVTVVED